MILSRETFRQGKRFAILVEMVLIKEGAGIRVWICCLRASLKFTLRQRVGEGGGGVRL